MKKGWSQVKKEIEGKEGEERRKNKEQIEN